MILKAQAITKQYLRQSTSTNILDAVKETSLTLEPGTVTVILGRSGSGKSTLLNMLAGLLQPTTGSVLLDDTDLYALGDDALSQLRNRRIGVVPQVQSLLGSLTVLENVKLPCLLFGKPSEETDARAEQLLGQMGIEQLANELPAALSGGEMRRAAIARAMMQKPAVVLADEPTGDLDDENTKLVFTIFRQLADEGTAVMIVTHESEAIAYADAVYRMNAGVLEKAS